MGYPNKFKCGCVRVAACIRKKLKKCRDDIQLPAHMKSIPRGQHCGIEKIRLLRRLQTPRGNYKLLASKDAASSVCNCQLYLRGFYGASTLGYDRHLRMPSGAAMNDKTRRGGVYKTVVARSGDDDAVIGDSCLKWDASPGSASSFQ